MQVRRTPISSRSPPSKRLPGDHHRPTGCDVVVVVSGRVLAFALVSFVVVRRGSSVASSSS